MEALPDLTRAQARELDRLALEELSIPSVVLMENAGRGAAEALLNELTASEGPVAVLCGRGNNAGDGYVLARHLDMAGVEAVLLETASPSDLSADAAVFREVARALGLRMLRVTDANSLTRQLDQLSAPACLVDGLLGTGFQGELREREASLLAALGEWLQGRGIHVVALDLPSGMDADTGVAATQTLTCQRTLTFAAPKVGFRASAARERTGKIEVIPIGLPRRYVERVL